MHEIRDERPNSMTDVVIASGARTPVGSFLGSFANLPAHDLGTVAIRSALERAKVVIDPERRRDIILHDAKDLAFAQGLELIEDAGLLEEVAGLVEWPVVLMGSFDERFLEIPDEVIRATIRNNQKCFVVRNPKTGKLANRFILTSNIEASDQGRAIVEIGRAHV